MSWMRWLLLGDFGQQIDLHRHADRLYGLQRRLVGKATTDAQQNDRIEALEREVLMLAAGLTAVIDLLREKGIATPQEVDAALSRGTAAAEAAAKERDEAAAAEQAQQAKVREQRTKARARRARLRRD